MTDAAKRLPDAVLAGAAVASPAPESRAFRLRLETMLVSGGDERIWLDPVSRRNRYGAGAAPAPEGLWFSSAVANPISEAGYAAAASDFRAITEGGADLAAWFDVIRARIAARMGVPGVEVLLAGSAAEAELAALAVARAALARPLVNIVIAPGETEEGVALAAAGAHVAHSAAFAPHVARGAPLEGWGQEDIVLRRVELRGVGGRLRPRAEIERLAGLAVADALRTGRAALLHVLDASRTGRGGPGRAVARDLLATAGGRAIVLVDASQLRCSFDQIRADLEAGFLVMVTGSAYAGGPPFCAALLIPPGLAKKLDALRLPPGFAAYAARHDWPADRAAAFEAADFAPANLGLGLRWTAALAEIEAYAAVPHEARMEILTLFAESARRGVAGNPALDFLDPECWRLGGRPATVYPIVTHRGDPAQARLLHDALRASAGMFEPSLSRPCHVGAPVLVGGRAALCLALSMPQANAVAARMAAGLDPDAAFLPLRREIELLFRKWGDIASRLGVNGGLTLAASNG